MSAIAAMCSTTGCRLSTPNEMSVSYRLISTLFDHYDLTALTGITPTYARNFGDRRTVRGGRHITQRNSMWQVGTPDLPSNDVRIELERVFRLLEPAWSQLCDLGTVYDANLWFYLGFYSDQPRPVFVIPPALLQRIVDLHAHVDIDPYCLGQEDLKPAVTPPDDADHVMIELNSTTATYALSSPELDPEQITRQTRLIPSRTMYSSSLSVDTQGIFPTNGEWQISPRQVMSQEGLDPIQAIVDTLLPAWSALRHLGQEYTATVTIASRRHCSEAGGGMSFSATEIERLVELNATLAIDLDCRHSDLLYFDDHV